MWRSIRVALPALVCVSLLALSGCAKKSADDMSSEGAGPEESLDTQSSGISEGRTSAPMLPVYFDFDASKIRGDQVPRIKANADFLKKNDDVQIRIEGNCDPRGTKEYNLALGERRALAAKKYLANMGVPSARMTTVSYGEERMLLKGQDELSWAQNRRDDFVITK